MDDRCNIEYPSRQKDGEKSWEPEHQSRKPDGKHPPEDSKKIELLPVGPSVKLGFWPFVKKPTDHTDDVLNVFPTRTERIRTKKSLERVGISSDLLEEEEIEHIGNSGPEITEGNGCTDSMDQPCHFSPSQKVHQPTGPGCMRKFQRKPGQDKTDEGDHHRKMEDDIEGAESTVNVACFIRFHMLRKENPFGP